MSLALDRLYELMEAGMEYPDASAKAAVEHGISTEDIGDEYDEDHRVIDHRYD